MKKPSCKPEGIGTSPLSRLKRMIRGELLSPLTRTISRSGAAGEGGLSAARLKLGIACAGLVLALSSWAFASGGDSTGGGIRTFTVLVGVIIALFGLAWAAKKYGPYARVKKSLGLVVIGRVPVGVKADLALVRVGKSVLLLGVTQNRISLLKDLDQGEFEKAFTEAESLERNL